MTYQLTTFNDLVVGQKAFFRKTITEADVSHFIAITGDMNPLHIDEPFAKQTFFGQRIVHGMLSASLFSTMVGLHLPGIGAIYKSQTLNFLRPVFIGDTLCAWFEIIAIDPETEQIDIRSWIENQNGETVIEGQASASLLRGLKHPGTRQGS